MAQISPPFRIMLVAVALLGAVWFVALRPKPEAGTDAPVPVAPGVAGLTKATGKAQAAVTAAAASTARTQAGGTSASAAEKTQVKVTKTANGAKVTKTQAVKPLPAKPANPAAPLLAALDRGQVVVLLFRNRSTDSADVARMVRSVGGRRKVVSRVASIKDVGKYETFTSGTPVTQAPTTIVIGPRRNAVVIVGFTSVGEISQSVADVRRSGRKAS